MNFREKYINKVYVIKFNSVCAVLNLYMASAV